MSIPKNVLRWSFYDFANSSYVLIFQAFLLPAFFSTILLSEGYSLSAWGIANGISTIAGVLLAIILGRYSDKADRLKVFRYIILICFFGMTVLAISVGVLINLVFFLYIFTNCLFIASLSLSDSILPHISDKNNSYEYSGFAWDSDIWGGWQV